MRLVENYENKKNARKISASREIQTLKLLINEIGFQEWENCSLLDLGCADKFLKHPCESEGWSYTGLDYSDVNFETENLPINSNNFNIVICLAVLEHLRDPSNFLREIYRSLKPGGIVYLSTPNFRMDWKNFYNDPTHVKPYTPESLEYLLELSGFKKISTFPGLRCKNIKWYRGKYRFFKAYYLLPFRFDTKYPVPNFLKGHARSIFALGMKP